MKKAVIVGGSNGIGLAIAKKLLESGYYIYIIDLRKPDINLSKYENFYSYIQCDLSDFDITIFDEISNDTEVQLLMITAGYGRVADFEYFHTAEINRMIKVNTIAGIQIVRKFYKTGESFCEVLLRYMSDTATNSYKLSEITGISVASVYRYQRYDCEISLEHTAAICIGLRLHPMRSRYLFSLTHISLNYNIQRDIIILHYLYGCAFSSEYSLSACNRELQSRGFRPLTSLGLTE